MNHRRALTISTLTACVICLPMSSTSANGEFDLPLDEVWLRSFNNIFYATRSPSTGKLAMCLATNVGSLIIPGEPVDREFSTDLTHLRMAGSGGIPEPPNEVYWCDTIRFDAAKIDRKSETESHPADITSWEIDISICRGKKTTLEYWAQQLNEQYQRKEIGDRRLLDSREARFDRSLACPVPGKYRYVDKKGWTPTGG